MRLEGGGSMWSFVGIVMLNMNGCCCCCSIDCDGMNCDGGIVVVVVVVVVVRIVDCSYSYICSMLLGNFLDGVVSVIVNAIVLNNDYMRWWCTMYEVVVLVIVNLNELFYFLFLKMMNLVVVFFFFNL
jgi:hypothetical protein